MNFKKPDISEIRSVEKLAQDDAFATLARSMRAIQEGKASSADIKRYLDAKAYIDPDRLAKTVEKDRLANLSGKYKNVGEEEIAKISRLRDYLMSHPDLKYGNEFNPQQVKALLYDLKTNGKPRSLKYDEMYDDLMGMYEELEKRIEEAYGPISKTDEPLGADGMPLFVNPSHMGAGAMTGTANAFTSADSDGDGVVTNEEFVQAFLLGMAGGTAASKAVATVLKKTNPKLFDTVKKLYDDGVDGAEITGMFAGKGAKGFDEAVKFSNTADKQQRFWIDDTVAKVDAEKMLKEADKDGYNMFEGKLGDILEHDALFKNYPELKNITVNYESPKGLKEEDIYYGAFFDPTDNSIVLGSGLNREEMKSALLHEVQHYIQEKEGWARGGSINSIPADMLLTHIYAKYKELPYVKKLVDDVRNKRLTHAEYKNKILDIANTTEDGGLKGLAHSLYERLAGEQESRAVQANLKHPELTPYEALIKEEGGLEEPIVKFGEGRSDHAFAIEKRFMDRKSGRVKLSEIEKEAEALPPTLSRTEFIGEFGTKDWVNVETPAGKVRIHVNKTYDHFTQNTYNADRSSIVGALKRTLTHPLFVVDDVVKQNVTYYKPFKGEDGITHLIGIAKDNEGKLSLKTFYDINIGEVGRLMKLPDGNVKFYKYSNPAGKTAQSNAPKTPVIKDEGKGLSEDSIP